MKKTILSVLVILAAFAFTNQTFAQDKEIHWMSLEEAVAAQQKNPKKIFMDAHTKWCGPCKLLDKKTFHNPDVVKYMNENYYAVKFDAEGNEKINFKGKTYTNPRWDASKGNGRNSSHQLAAYFRVHAYPTMIFLDEQANYLAPIKGYKTPQQLELYLKLFATDDYKNVKTKEQWEAYQKNFKPTFK